MKKIKDISNVISEISQEKLVLTCSFILILIFLCREMEKYPHQIRNRGKRMSTDFTTDDDEHIYIRPKVKFDQTETETEDQVPISTCT